jgi:predicted ribosomally synthesized peptide with SipW-like signal peptide
MFGKKRLLIAVGTLASVGAAVTLVTGVTFGLFSASSTSTPANTFTAGTVTLGGPPATVQCVINPMAPGDSSTGYSPLPSGQNDTKTAACTFAVKYTGTLPAWLGVSFTTGGTGLYDGLGMGGLQYQITSDGGTTYTTAGGALNPNSSSNPLLVSTTPDAGGSSTLHTITVNYALPTTGANSNSYQGLTATLSITVSAVQSANNGDASACTAGSRCAGITSWS